MNGGAPHGYAGAWTDRADAARLDRHEGGAGCQGGAYLTALGGYSGGTVSGLCLERPRLFDANFGARPLEQDFRTWTWGRYPDGDRALCFYDGVRRDGSRLALEVEADAKGLRQIQPPRSLEMKRTTWGLKRQTRGDAGTIPIQRVSLLDAPSYSRSAVETQVDGRPVQGGMRRWIWTATAGRG